jgi:hypothetical protein
MADLTITAASVAAGTGARAEHGTAGAAVTAGQTVYLDPATNTYKLADANSGTADARVTSGLALHAAASGQPLAVHTSGPLTIGATVTAGVGYYQSSTPGGICPVADLASGAYPTLIGFATSATVINVDIEAAGVSL